MTIEQFIEKAIEGGWEFKEFSPMPHDYSIEGKVIQIWWNSGDGEVDGAGSVRVEEILLDPLAWKAVGKVQWWDKSSTNGCAMQCAWWPYKLKNENQLTLPNKTYLVMNNESYSMWEYKMHRMIDALAEGKTIEQYLETL